jgi:hypothetical protein
VENFLLKRRALCHILHDPGIGLFKHPRYTAKQGGPDLREVIQQFRDAFGKIPPKTGTDARQCSRSLQYMGKKKKVETDVISTYPHTLCKDIA